MDTLTHERRMYAEKRIRRLTREIDALLESRTRLAHFAPLHGEKSVVLKALNSKQTSRNRWLKIVGARK